MFVCILEKAIDFLSLEFTESFREISLSNKLIFFIFIDDYETGLVFNSKRLIPFF